MERGGERSAPLTSSLSLIITVTRYITTAHEEISTIECPLNSDLIAVHNWLKRNKLSCNTSKTSYMAIGSRQNLANAKFMNLELDDRPIEHKPSTKLLGVHIDEGIIRSNIFHPKSLMACECCI